MTRVQKNIPQGLQNTDNRRMFAMSYILTSEYSSLQSRAFFVPVSICGVTPLYSYNDCTACWSSVGQGVGNSLYYIVTPTNLLSVMSYTEKQGLSGNNSTVQPTPALRKRGYHHKFLIEKDAKNRTYSFILSRGLLNDFHQFCILTRGADSHILAVSYLMDLCEEKK